jgi:hypothetical protein
MIQYDNSRWIEHFKASGDFFVSFNHEIETLDAKGHKV